MRFTLTRSVVRRVRGSRHCASLAFVASILLAPAFAQVAPAPGAETQASPAAAPTAVSLSTNSDKEGATAAWQAFTSTHSTATNAGASKPGEDFHVRLDIARHHRQAHLYPEAEAAYTSILEAAAPEPIQRTALLELAQTVREEEDLARAQQIYAQYVNHWPHDPGVPEVLLDQGLVYREMGLNSMAISKFYAVMTSALVVKDDSFDFYQKLVLRAQNEIAETQFQLDQFADAGDSFARLLKLESPPANRSTIQHRYVQCLVSLGRREEAIAQAQDFLTRYPKAPERPEVRFLCATALKQSGRDTEALQQVLGLLQEQHAGNGCDPKTLAFWQRRAGNELANQFYQQGDPMKALDIYIGLAALDTAPDWQLPVWYQIGLVCERLNQPAKASQYYENISKREKELGTNATPSLKAVIEMAKWRKDFLGWQLKTEATDIEFHSVMLGSGAPAAQAAHPQPY